MNDGTIQTILSSQGSHQGDPAGSFLFCLGLAPRLRAIAQQLPDCLIAAIIDDVTVCSPINIIPRVFQVVSQNLAAYNIVISFPKSLIYTTPALSARIPVETPSIIPRTTRGFKLLGGPMASSREDSCSLIPSGDDQFLEEFYQTLLHNIKLFLNKLSKMSHTQSAFQILVLSVNNKIAHLLRSDPLLRNSPLEHFVNDFDATILDSFKNIFGIAELTPQQISQIRLPERKSGLGLLSSSQMGAPAFIGSSRQVLHELNSRGITTNILRSVFADNHLNMDLQWVQDLRSMWNQYRDQIYPGPLSFPEWSSSNFMNLVPQNLQHRLFNEYTEGEWKRLFDNSNTVSKIRLNSCSAIGSAAFLRAPAHIPGCFFNNEEFAIAVKIRINVRLNLLCPATCICGSDLDDFGDHLFKCRVGSEWEQRHSSLVHITASLLRSVSFEVQHEVPLSSLGPFRDLDTSGNGRMDLTITSGDLAPILADVTITHPIISQPSPALSTMCSPLYFAKHREATKIRKYGARAAQINNQFVPLVLETYGALGPVFSSSLKIWAKRAAQFIHPSKSAQIIRF